MDKPEIIEPPSKNGIRELGYCILGFFVMLAFTLALNTIPQALLVFVLLMVVSCVKKIPLFIKLFIFAAAVAFGFLSKPTSYTTDERIGNVAGDGRRSDAISRGAASHHGGVNNWIYVEELLDYRHYIIWHLLLTLYPLILSWHVISEKKSHGKK